MPLMVTITRDQAIMCMHNFAHNRAPYSFFGKPCIIDLILPSLVYKKAEVICRTVVMDDFKISKFDRFRSIFKNLHFELQLEFYHLCFMTSLLIAIPHYLQQCPDDSVVDNIELLVTVQDSPAYNKLYLESL